MALSATEVNQLKQAPAIDGVIPAVLGRWSSRSFAPRQVSADDLARIFEAARWSASAFNEQPWRFIIGTTGTAAHQKLADSLMGFNKSWAAQAPVLILAMHTTTFAHNGKENPYASFDLGAAVGALTLQAAELGLTTHTMAGFDQAVARAAFDVPADLALSVVVALGYQDEPSKLTDEALLAKETSPRTRRALDELVFTAIGEPATLAK